MQVPSGTILFMHRCAREIQISRCCRCGTKQCNSVLPPTLAMASSSDGQPDVKSVLLDLCRVNRNLGKHEEKHLQRLVEVLKHHLRHKCFELLREAEGQAVLFTYSADVTPLKCVSTKVDVQGGSQVVRKGRDLEELLLQRGLLKTTLASGEPRMAFLFTDIRPMTEGKKRRMSSRPRACFFPYCERRATKTSAYNMCVQIGRCGLLWTGCSANGSQHTTSPELGPSWEMTGPCWS